MALAQNIGLSKTPPVEEQPQATVTNTGTEPIAETPQVTQPTVQTEPPKAEPPKVEVFFEEFNKRYNTAYKTDDEIKSILETPKKISEYEGKLSEFEVTKKSIEDYKKKIEELEESQDPLKYFSSPDAYKAEQLRIKYPKSNPYLLQEIAMTDVNKMGDLDVLVKDKLLFVPDAPKEEVIRKVVLKKYGIDPTTPPEEWDEISVGEMKLDAAAARDKINGLKNVIEMPKQILTKEERAKEEADAKVKREQAFAPLKDKFGKYDKFSKEGFEFDVPDEYKSKLPDMFKSMFIDAGLEPTDENMETAVELRDAMFLLEYFPKIKEVIAKEAGTKLEAKIDAELHNTQPPNTATASDQNPPEQLPGKSLTDFLKDQKMR